MFAKSFIAFSILFVSEQVAALPINSRADLIYKRAVGDFGICSTPEIEFGVGFDGRKETSFEPKDQASFNHGSAQNIDIITQFICDTLTNKCKADQTAKDTCQSAIAKSKTGTPKTGVQADLFNSVFGIKTNFAAVASVDDQGRVVAGTGSGNAGANNAGNAGAAAGNAGNAGAANNAGNGAAASSGGIGDFGKCSTPQIEFGVGFDGRKETSFEPTDKASFNHGSAQNIDIITQFVCDTLTNSCGADQTAKDTCQSAIAKSKTGTPKTGVQADLFNSVFGITTNFAAVASVDDQGRVVAGTGSAAAGSNAGAAAGSDAGAAAGAASSCNSGAADAGAADQTANAGAADNTAAAGGIGDFGKCSVPQIEFGVGFDGRKETSFEPTDKASFNHGSAQNIDIISKFICDQLTNSCGADQTAKDTCQTAIDQSKTGTPKTGAQADLFNAVFGIKTNFAAVASVDDQGRVVAGTGSGNADAGAANNAGNANNAGQANNAGSANNAGAAAGAAAGGIGDFGKCSVPQIEFGAGFEGRKETSFQPVDKASFNHGSAQNIDIITQFICDTLTNSCGADQTAKTTCASAIAKSKTGAPKTGIQADLFNSAFGIKTNFAKVAAIDNQGNVVAGSTA